ncbi:MAG: T9SS type A sorting domain-containing protein [Bacteroidetes bacterium]|nr:T9SS type A sorting domain-containing protein [Bacteroidota bacterium]
MKRFILPFLMVTTTAAFAQRAAIYGFGATDAPQQWKSIQSFSAPDDASVKLVYDHQQSVPLMNGFTQRNSGRNYSGEMVAAAGYAAASQKLFFIPMFQKELRWTNLEENGVSKFFSITSPVLDQLDFNKVEHQITRMAIGNKGVGYALTNDAMHLIEFTTGNTPSIKDLGQLVDARSNGQNSVHSSCASFGGDMVMGDDDNLYLITMRNHIYQFNPANKITHYLGAIKGLPASFTSNGAAALASGELILSCSNGDQNSYVVDPKNWEARPYFVNHVPKLNLSDLASGHLLARKAKSNPTNNIAASNALIQLYPNPVVGNRVQISMTKAVSGNHQVQLMDLSGKLVHQQNVNLNNGAQTFQLNIPAKIARGTYLLKLTDPASKSIYTDKLILQGN